MENISNIIVAVAAVFGAILAALVGGITIWTFRDIRSRSRDILVQILATVMVAVIPIAGLIVYLLLRPRETLQEGYVRALEEESLLASFEHQEFCPTCGRRVDADMQFCPSCHTKLRNACANCGRAVHLSWDLCPYCGTEQVPEMPTSVRISKPNQPRVSAPQAAAQPRRTATPTPQVKGTPGQPISLPSTQAAKAKFGNLLDRVGGAIDTVASKAQQRMATPSPTSKPPAPADDFVDELPKPIEPPSNPNGSRGNSGAPTTRKLRRLADEDELE